MTDIATLIREDRQKLAILVTERIFSAMPELRDRYGETGMARCLEDTAFHLGYLAEALHAGDAVLFNDYVDWAQTMLGSRNIPAGDLIRNLQFMEDALEETYGSAAAGEAVAFLADARRRLERGSEKKIGWIRQGQPLYEEAREYLAYLLDGDRHSASVLIERLVEDGVPVPEIYEHIFQATQYEVGVLWQQNRISVAHEHFCTAATQTIMSRLYPHIFTGKRNGKVLIACSVAEELHELGIRMVADFFEMDGWDTYYLGANTPESAVVEAVAENRADLLAISVTIPIRVNRAESMIRAVRSRVDLQSVRILTGGYPFLAVPDLWRRIGADGTAGSAKEAVAEGNRLTGPQMSERV